MTKPWYVKSFSSSYMGLYAHRDNDEAKDQITKMLALISPDENGPLLDLCCGAGRHLKALRELEMKNLVGIDLSGDLLKAASQSLNNGTNDRVELIQSDMRQIPFENYFSTVVSLFTSFGYFSDDSENASVINGIYKALKSDGRFLMDYLNLDFIVDNLVPENEVVKDEYTAVNKRWITDDGKRVEKKTVVTMKDGEEHIFEESVRMFSDNEMKLMFEAAGFKNVSIYGTLEGDSLSTGCSRMIITAQK